MKVFNISEYIQSNEKLKKLDILTVYLTIAELCKDEKLVRNGKV